jgi:hypothetical protein
MFRYCQRVLDFPEAVAYKRIQAARAARRHPEVLDAVRCGELHVTGVSLLAPQLSSENAGELIRAARHKTADEIRRLLADRQPKPDVPATVRRIPGPTAQACPATIAVNGTAAGVAPAGASGNAALAPLGGESPSRPAPLQAAPAPRARTEPLGGERYCVRFTADRELHEELQELRALMRHQVPDGDLGVILGRAVALLLAQVRKQKFGECAAPRPVQPSSEKPSRQIPAAIRRAVSLRDGGR